MESGSQALLTDLYQLTMAYAHWKEGRRQDAVFHLHFRKPPFAGGYAIACGLEPLLRYVESFHFDEDDIGYLRTLRGADDEPLFEQAFLDELHSLRLSVDVDAVPEGTVVFPNEPLVRVSGPIVECQLLETALLNIVNFQTLVATKAARICLAAEGEPVLEFGLRRAQGPDGGVSASRAAYVGGVASTSNVLAGKRYGIPVAGTHAHSWVMAFDTELRAFEAYARALPNNAVFLVDTYDTLEGVRNAIEVGLQLKRKGHRLLGIRLDSGDLAWLSIEARRLLDEAGLAETFIVGSNDLDEHIITSLKQQGARLSVWGVGTKLATCHDDPALGGVYKLGAIRTGGGAWEPRLKLSEETLKISIPGMQQVRRYRDAQGFVLDAIYTDGAPPIPGESIVDPADPTRRKRIPEHASHTDLLVPVFRAGERVYAPPPLSASRALAQEELHGFHAGIKRLLNPHRYPVGLEASLHALRTRLILEARARSHSRPSSPSPPEPS